jgi:hypothetical protein
VDGGDDYAGLADACVSGDAYPASKAAVKMLTVQYPKALEGMLINAVATAGSTPRPGRQPNRHHVRNRASAQ